MRIAILLAALAFPVLEIALLIKAGGVIGVWGVLLLILATAVLGVSLVRQQGLATANRVSDALQKGQSPAVPAMSGALVVLAGLLLIAPGLLTDIMGLLLMIPPLRNALAARLVPDVGEPDGDRGMRSGAAGEPMGNGPIIEGEFERLDEHDPKEPRR